MKKTNNYGGSTILSILVLLYFAFLLGGMFFFSKSEPKLCLSIFGTLLIFISIAVISGSIKDGVKIVNILIGILTGFGGICLTVFPLLFLYAPSFENVDGQRFGISIFILFVCAIGFSILVLVLGNIIRNKSRCTCQVNAKVTDRIKGGSYEGVSKSTGRNMRTFRFRYEFTFNGFQYEVEDDMGSNMDLVNVGDIITLYINPDDPNVFYRKKPKTTICLFIMGMAWLAGGIIGLITYVF